MIRKQLLAVLAVIGMATYIGGCSSSNNQQNGGGSFVNTSNVDLAVGDAFAQQVSLYFNILGFVPTTADSFPSPDVVLDAAGSGIQNPASMIYAGTLHQDLVICDSDFFSTLPGNSTVKIFRDYASLVDGALADTTFTNGGALAIDNPVQCAYDSTEDVLVVVNSTSDEVILIYDYIGIAAGTDPAVTAVTLNSAGSLIVQPFSAAVTGDDLWVANSGNNSPGEACVTGYRDIATLANADAPDVRLDADVSFFGPAGGFGCFQVQVGDNPFNALDLDTLYVSTVDGSVFGFVGASTLANNALPDFILLPSSGQLEVPGQPEIAGGRLLVPNFGFGIVGAPGAACSVPAVVGFDTIGSLVTDQAPALELDLATTGIANAYDISFAGGALFMVGPTSCSLVIPFSGSVVIYADGYNIASGQTPSLVIPGSTSIATDLIFPTSLQANVVESGT